VVKDQVGHFGWPLEDPKAVSHLDQRKKQTSLFIAEIMALILDVVWSGLANSARGMGFPGAGQPSKTRHLPWTQR